MHRLVESRTSQSAFSSSTACLGVHIRREPLDLAKIDENGAIVWCVQWGKLQVSLAILLSDHNKKKGMFVIYLQHVMHRYELHPTPFLRKKL